MQLEIYSSFFYGFSASAVLPFIVGGFLAIKRALWASAFSDV